ncbi:MAG: DUF262 domain-containing HNH endonuclease family protein [Gammaproteobacteria bacterium]|nr:DUF262 domain-containing HNH endonuclease family protein [Gammaproteobacteria bacterium]
MQAQDMPFLQLLNTAVRYVIPLWQRRYCWGKTDIERLGEDLMTIGRANSDSTHYGGTLLTYSKTGTAGVLPSIQVIDGQQRLTTISIFLACIANKLEKEGPCRDWTPEIVRNGRLMNPDANPDNRYKLCLQEPDQKEYRSGIEGIPEGSGAVAQAWKTVQRFVNKCDIGDLLSGLERLTVVSIGLHSTDDPQQIFESLNATGKQLTESEKVKNWLLIGLPEEQQREYYEQHWLDIEKSLGAERSSSPVDHFFLDFMRWRRGTAVRTNSTYETFRRWAIDNNRHEDRGELCSELALIARLYGILTGTLGPHPNKKIESEVRHLRALGIDVYRPLALRLMYDALPRNEVISMDELAKILGLISSWITRIWLTGKPTHGLSKVIAQLASNKKPTSDQGAVSFWNQQFELIKDRNLVIPRDQDVREGIERQIVYGGARTRPTKAILCTLMEKDHPGESPPRDRLTIEHIMPRTLTKPWRDRLGASANELHERFKDTFANLTLSSDSKNSEMGAAPFEEKQLEYQKSPIGITKRIAEEAEWNEEALKRRSDYLTERILSQWPWVFKSTQSKTIRNDTAKFRWRIEENDWHYESIGRKLILNVTSGLLRNNSSNIQRLLGDSKYQDLISTESSLTGTIANRAKIPPVPDFEDYAIYVDAPNHQASIQRCLNLGERCEVEIEVELLNEDLKSQFWSKVQARLGKYINDPKNWKGRTQRVDLGNAFGDKIVISLSEKEFQCRIWVSTRVESIESRQRMESVSWFITEQMPDQIVEGDPKICSEKNDSIVLRRDFVLEQEDEWDEASEWIVDQFERLITVLSSL